MVDNEVRVAGTVGRRRDDMTGRLADLIGRTGRRGRSNRNRLLGIALAGAVSESLVEWVQHPEPRPSTDELVEVLVGLYLDALPR